MQCGYYTLGEIKKMTYIDIMDSDKEKLLFEIYSLHAGLADNVSERRSVSNRYYITIHSALILSIGYSVEKFSDQTLLVYLICIVGCIISILWYFNIRSYRQLNSGKFKALHKLEEKLPFQFYKEEWDILGSGDSFNKYFQLTKVESVYPWIALSMYVLLALLFKFM